MKRLCGRKNVVLVKVIMVSINAIYDANRREKSGCSLEDMARGDWRVGNSPSAEACEVLVASYHGRLMGAWKIKVQKNGRRWMLPSQSPRRNLPPKLQATKKCDSVRRVCELLPLDCATVRNVLSTLSGKRLCSPFGYFDVWRKIA